MKRILTAIVLIGLIVINLILLDCNPIFFAVFNGIITAFCIYEMNKAFKDKLHKSYSILNIFLAIFILPSFLLFKSLNGIFIIICFFFLIALIIFTFNPTINLQSLQAFVFILFYPVLLLSFNYALIYSQNALFLLVCVFGIGPMADSFAYIVGSTLKGKKLCPLISPKKTISGAIGGLIGGLIAGIIIYFVFITFLSFNNLPSLLTMALVGFVGAIFTSLGDLTESAIKRKFNIKDFGNILPGHGGVLDRMDGIMFNSIFILTFFTYIIPLV